MNFNTAEIRKSFQLTMTKHRVILSTLILLAIFCITYLSEGYITSTANTALKIFFLAVYLYGAVCASSCFSQERGQQTWDNIRLSSLSAWDITIGKLVGSTLFAWFLGAICLTVLTIAIAAHASNWSVILDFLLLISSGLLIQTIAMNLDLQSIDSDKKNVSSTIIGIGLLIFTYFALSITSVLIIYNDIGMILGADTSDMLFSSVSWYGISYKSLHFCLCSVLAFLCWAIIAVYRQVNEIMHCKSKAPWVWASFLAYIIVYFSGFAYELEIPEFITHSMPTIAFTISTFSTYAAITYKQHNIIHYRILWKYLNNKQWRNFAENIPLWWVSFLFTCLSAIAIVFTSAELLNPVYLRVTFISALFFILRDLGIILYFSLGNKSTKPRFLSICYLLLLYILLPTLLSSAGLTLGKTAWLFFPPTSSDSYLSILPSMTQAALMMCLLWRQNKKLRALL